MSPFELLHDDALDFLKREPRDWSDWKLVANLPYSVASPILVELAQSTKPPERMVVTLQLEVARRLMAGAGDDDYGILTLLVQLNYEPRDWFKIPSGCFFPTPDVDSACVVLARRQKPLVAGRRSRHVQENRQTCLFAATEDDVEIIETGLAATRFETGISGVGHLAAGTRGKTDLGTICRLHQNYDQRKMSEEIFDIVNERDEVIDRGPRGEVHRLGLRHRAVHVLVFNSRGEVFLQKRSMKKDTAQGKWDSSSSGHVDSGEDYDACAVRELREEIGLRLDQTPRTAVQNRGAPGNRLGILLGLSLRKRRAVRVESRRNRDGADGSRRVQSRAG